MRKAPAPLTARDGSPPPPQRAEALLCQGGRVCTWAATRQEGPTQEPLLQLQLASSSRKEGPLNCWPWSGLSLCGATWGTSLKGTWPRPLLSESRAVKQHCQKPQCWSWEGEEAEARSGARRHLVVTPEPRAKCRCHCPLLPCASGGISALTPGGGAGRHSFL